MASDLGVFGPVKKVTGHVRVAVGEQPRGKNLYYSPGNANPIGITAGKGDLVNDPLFVDAANRNFRLSAKSPALGKGTKTGYNYDLDGYPVKGTKPALGAYEF